MDDLIKSSQSINSSSAFPAVKEKVSKAYVEPAKPKKAAAAAPSVNADLIKEEKNKWRLKINGYVDSKKFQHLLDGDFEKIDLKKAEKMTVEQMKDILDAIRARVACKDKRDFVDSMFNNGVELLAFGTVIATGRPEYGFIPKIVATEKATFDDELEQISIEMDDKWIPSPEMRIGIKIAKIIMNIQMEIKKHQQQEELNSKKIDKDKVDK